MYAVKTPEGFTCCSSQTAAKIQSIVVTQKRAKAKREERKAQAKERAQILYLMRSKLYSIYIFIMYYPPRRANKKSLITQREGKKYTPCIVFTTEQATCLYTNIYNLMLCNSIFFSISFNLQTKYLSRNNLIILLLNTLL